MSKIQPDPTLQSKVYDAQNALAATAKSTPSDTATIKSELKDLFVAQSAVDKQTGADKKSSKAVDEEQRTVDWLKQSGVDPQVINGIAKGLSALQVGGDAKGRTKAGSLGEMGDAIDGMKASTLTATADTSGKDEIYKEAHPGLHTAKIVGEDVGIAVADGIIAGTSSAGSNFVNGTTTTLIPFKDLSDS